MDTREEILGAIDRLQRLLALVDAEAIANHLRYLSPSGLVFIKLSLRAMAKAGLVVYDRKASGWRRV